MHKVFKYIIIFIIVYFSVNILTYLIMRSTRSNKTVQLNIPGNSPAVQITQARGSTEGGIIRGKITNNSSDKITDIFLRLRFFSKRDVEMGNQYITIKSLKPAETMEFIADYSYRMVDKITGELMTKEALIGEINKVTDNGTNKDKFSFSKLDLSKVDPRNIDWSKLDPKNIDWAKLDPRNIDWSQFVNGSRINTAFTVNLFGNQVQINPAILFGVLIFTGMYAIF